MWLKYGGYCSLQEETDSYKYFIIVLAAVEKETILPDPEIVSAEDLAVQYEELLREHARTGSHHWTQAEITDSLIATQHPEMGLKPKNAEILVDLINHKDQNLKNAVVLGIARCSTFSYNQVRDSCVSQLGSCTHKFPDSTVHYYTVLYMAQFKNRS